MAYPLMPPGVARILTDACHALYSKGLAFYVILACSLASAEQPGKAIKPAVRIMRAGSATSPRFEVRGLSAAQLKSLRTRDWEQEDWAKLLAVYVHRKSIQPLPAIYGDYTVATDCLVFEPAFPLKPGLTYHARFHPQALGAESSGRSRVEQLFTLPRGPSRPAAAVVQVFPSGPVLPENQLKFYIHFSQPMSRGEAYRRIHLVDQAGKTIPFPFLELAEELWDPDGTRFTLLFDPGRIKRGLKPREEVGPALLEGGSYTLQVDRAWRDASGQSLKVAFTKKFKVSAPDNEQPDPRQWKLSKPVVNSRVPLEVRFNEPLDHAMLHRVLGILDSAGKPVPGTITVDQQETRWSFQPSTSWQPGDYQLVVNSELEDRSGNSIGRKFEIDVFRKVDKKITRKTIQLPFSVAP
jgi:hypothetical protein